MLAPLFSDLPKPVLAALIIEAVVMGMMDLPEMRRLARVKPFDFWIAIAAILGTLVFGVLAGVVIGIGAVAGLAHLRGDAPDPACRCSAASPAPRSSASSTSTPTTSAVPGVVVIRLDGGLFFATSDALEDRIRDVVHSTAGRRPGSSSTAGGSNFIDSQGAAKLGEIVELAEQSGIDLRLARVKPEVSRRWTRDGVLDRLGTDKVHGNVSHAVQAHTQPRMIRSGEVAACSIGG